MLRTCAIILTLWMGFRLLTSVSILVGLLALGSNSPALIILFGNMRGQGLDPRALATINGLAVVANSALAAFSLLSLAVIWTALVRRVVWAFWALGGSLLFVEVVRSAGAWHFYHQGNPWTEAATILPVIAGLACAGMGVFSRTGQVPG